MPAWERNSIAPIRYFAPRSIVARRRCAICLPRPLLEALFAEGDAASLIHETAFTQPALFVVQAALTDLWRSWGVVPDVVLGHSVGEFAAAYCAGVYTLEDCLSLVAIAQG